MVTYSPSQLIQDLFRRDACKYEAVMHVYPNRTSLGSTGLQSKHQNIMVGSPLSTFFLRSCHLNRILQPVLLVSSKTKMPQNRFSRKDLANTKYNYPFLLVCHLLRSGVAALFGPQSGTTSSHVQSICDAMEIPHIETRWDYRLKRDDYSVNLYPHPTALSSVSITYIFFENIVNRF